MKCQIAQTDNNIGISKSVFTWFQFMIKLKELLDTNN